LEIIKSQIVTEAINRGTAMSGREHTVEDETASLGRAGDEIYDLELYVSGATAHSRAAVANIKDVAERHLKGRYRLVVTDLYQEPVKAREEQIIVVPMLVKRRPLPLRRIVGDLSSEEHVLLGLQLDPKTEEKEEPT
jgi:circadian clock protein KaiB